VLVARTGGWAPDHASGAWLPRQDVTMGLVGGREGAPGPETMPPVHGCRART